MDRFWKNLQKNLKQHEKRISDKISYSKIFKEIQDNGIHLQPQLKSNYLHNLLLESEINNCILGNIFKKIITDCVNYVNDNQIDFYDLENQFRSRKINIYIIARKIDNNNNDVICELDGICKNFEANFVLTEHMDYYVAKLKKFGYDNYQDNLNNLKNCGILLLKLL